jgi:hypothetical protein
LSSVDDGRPEAVVLFDTLTAYVFLDGLVHNRTYVVRMFATDVAGNVGDVLVSRRRLSCELLHDAPRAAARCPAC